MLHYICFYHLFTTCHTCIPLRDRNTFFFFYLGPSVCSPLFAHHPDLLLFLKHTNHPPTHKLHLHIIFLGRPCMLLLDFITLTSFMSEKVLNHFLMCSFRLLPHMSDELLTCAAALGCPGSVLLLLLKLVWGLGLGWVAWGGAVGPARGCDGICSCWAVGGGYGLGGMFAAA